MRGLAAMFLFVVVAAASVGCGGDGEEATAPSATTATTAGPTVSPTAAPSPTADWMGPLFVYMRSIERPDETGHGRYVFQAVVYDVGAQREFAAFQPGEPNKHVELAIAGDKIVANLRSRVVCYDADGANPMVLREASSDGAIIEVGASPDGTKLALTEERASPQGLDWAPVTYVVVLDIASGEEIFTMPQSDAGFEGFIGQAGLITWRDDGQGVVVQGYTYSERPGGTATVMLDGSVRTHDLRDYVKVASNGRYVEHGFQSSMKLGGMSSLQSEIILYDLTAETQLASVGADDLLFMPREWSPDGTEFLYSTYSPRASTDYPGYLERDPASERSYLLRIDGSEPEPVSDKEAVREGWYGERHVQIRCLGEVRHYTGCVDDQGRSQPVDIYVGVAFVGSGENVEIVGFIDR